MTWPTRLFSVAVAIALSFAVGWAQGVEQTDREQNHALREQNQTLRDLLRPLPDPGPDLRAPRVLA